VCACVCLYCATPKTMRTTLTRVYEKHEKRVWLRRRGRERGRRRWLPVWKWNYCAARATAAATTRAVARVWLRPASVDRGQRRKRYCCCCLYRCSAAVAGLVFDSNDDMARSGRRPNGVLKRATPDFVESFARSRHILFVFDVRRNE